VGKPLLDHIIVNSSSKVEEKHTRGELVQARKMYHTYPATILDEEQNNPASRHAKTTRLLWLGPASMSLTSFARTVWVITSSDVPVNRLKPHLVGHNNCG